MVNRFEEQKTMHGQIMTGYKKQEKMMKEQGEMMVKAFEKQERVTREQIMARIEE